MWLSWSRVGRFACKGELTVQLSILWRLILYISKRLTVVEWVDLQQSSTGRIRTRINGVTCTEIFLSLSSGFTPLHHCLKISGTETTLQMARLLLERGADPNAQNRLREVPLANSVLFGNTDYIKLLLEFGVISIIFTHLHSVAVAVNASGVRIRLHIGSALTIQGTGTGT